MLAAEARIQDRSLKVLAAGKTAMVFKMVGFDQLMELKVVEGEA